MARPDLLRALVLHGLHARDLRGVRHLQLHGLPAQLSEPGDGPGALAGGQAAAAALLSAVLHAAVADGPRLCAQLQARHPAVRGAAPVHHADCHVNGVFVVSYQLCTYIVSTTFDAGSARCSTYTVRAHSGRTWPTRTWWPSTM